MTRGSDTDLVQGAGIGESPTLPRGTMIDESFEPADSMDALLAAVAAAPPVRIGRREGVGIAPDTLVDGRFRVLRRLGGGGMGVVYLAEDVELQRQVALKLHLGELDSQELARLRREARVMARLSDASVLQVHMVGTHEGRLFIAMEFAEGGTLKTWLEAGPRPWRDTVEMLAQAGRGLAAAHQVGVVHRDFKPDNVLIGADGRPRVADFGLARRWEDPAELATGGAAIMKLEDAHRFTMTGAVVGTPAYMSPEQFDGIEVGPASDQFSFCVVLYEALLGRRPFSGRTTMELAAAVHMGELQPIPPGVRLPRSLLSLVTRGLRPLPGDRHPSMEALVDALERLHGARARRTRWTVGGAMLGAALLVGNQISVMAAPVPCEQAEEGLGEAWDDVRREAVVTAWPAADVTAIDEWTAAWKAQRHEVCEATRVREDQSELAFTLRMACLDRMAARLDALTEELAGDHEGGPGGADVVRAELPVLGECEDVEALDRLVNRFSNDSLRSTVDQDRAWREAEALLTRADTRMRLGLPGVQALAEQALALAEAHELAFVETTALVLLADAHLLHGELAEAAALNERALPLALGVGHDLAAADLVLARAEAAIDAGRPDDAEIHLSYFEALLPRLREPEEIDRRHRRAALIRGRLSLARGDAEAAAAAFGPLVDAAGVEPVLRVAALRGLGGAQERLGRYAEAIATWTRMVVLVEADQGPEGSDLAAALNNIANARLSLDEPKAALDDLARAEAISTRTLGPEHPLVPTLLTNQGLAMRRMGDLAQAEVLQQRSLALRTKIYGESHPSLAYALDELGELARLRGDPAGALVQLERGLRLREGALGPEHPLVATTLTLIAQVQLDRGETSAARAHLERAEAILDQHAGEPRARARVALLLARAIDEPAVAGEWAVMALTLAERAGVPGDAVRDEAQAWLRDHGAVPSPGSG